MKKAIFIFAVAALIVLFNITALAKSGDAIGNIYSTDILAFINDVPVQSYSIDGKTAIILEDLAEYGIRCNYSDELRTLVANSEFWDSSLKKQVERGKVGSIVGKIYETDIKTYMNGLPIQAYAIKGKMAVAIEDLGKTEKGFEYSPYNMKCVWNGKDRTIKLYFLYNNLSEVFKLLESKPLSLKIENYTISFEINHFMPTSASNYYSGGFNPPAQYPVYCGTQKVGIGFNVGAAYIYYPADKKVTLSFGDNSGIYYDLEIMKKIIDEIEISPPTYEEVLEYYEDWIYWTGHIIDRIDTDEYTFLYCSQGNSSGNSEWLVRIDRNGEYKDYSEDFQSVSYSGNKHFDNVKIDVENETVTFGYDVYYVIDLKTGVMSKK